MKIRSKNRLQALLVLSLFLGCSNFSHADTPNWQPYNPGMTGANVSEIAFDPNHPRDVFLGTHLGGVYYSHDDGKSWEKMGEKDLTGSYITRIVVHPKNPNEIYVATYFNGIYKTTDHGQTWQQINNGLRVPNIETLTFNPQNPNELFAGTNVSDFFKTTDGGQTWIEMNKGLNDENIVYSIAINPNNPKEIFLGIENDYMSDKNSLFHSVDGGATWQVWRCRLDGKSIFQLTYAPNKANRLFAATDDGAYKSDDDGISWSEMTPFQIHDDPKIIYSIAINPKNPDEMYLSSYVDGVYKTKSGGSLWWPINQTFDPNSVFHLALNPAAPNQLYLSAGDDGFYTSMDSGDHWQSAITNMSNLEINALAVNPKYPDLMFAGSKLKGFWATYDRKGWSLVPGFTRADEVTAVAIDPVHTQNVIVGLWRSEKRSTTLYYSNDYGHRFNEAKINVVDKRYLPSNIVCLSFNPTNSKQVFACDWADDVYRSEDGGATWSVQAIADDHMSRGMFSIQFNPQNSKEIYSAGFGGIYKSVDGGDHWQKLPFNFETTGNAFNSLVIDPVNPKKLYVSVATYLGDDHPSLYKTEDGGLSWSVANNGLPVGEPISAVMIDPLDHNTLYASTGNDSMMFAFGGKGIFVTHDAGDHWQALNNGLIDINVLALAISDNKLIAGTAGSGVFVSSNLQIKN